MYWNSLCKCSKHYDYQKPSISSCLNSKLLYLLAALSKFWMVCVGLAQCNSNMTMKPWRRHKNPKLLIWTTSPPHSFKYSSGYFIQIFILYVHCKYNTQSWTLGKESVQNEGSDKFQNSLCDSWCQSRARQDFNADVKHSYSRCHSVQTNGRILFSPSTHVYIFWVINWVFCLIDVCLFAYTEGYDSLLIIAS